MIPNVASVGPAVDTAAIVLCVCFLCYVAAILWTFLHKRSVEPGDSSATSWHLLVPCLDEAAVIARTVRGLRAAHPSAHVWCIDDASEDDTPRALVEFADDLMVHVVWRKRPDARRGKGPALNAGWSAVRDWVAAHDVRIDDVVVGVIDADARLASDALSVISGPEFFGDPGVGAVQVQVRMLNRGLPEHRLDGNDPAPGRGWRSLLVQLQDVEFRTVIAAMQGLRRRSGSVGMGGNGQFTRLAILNRIAERFGTPWHGALLEDFELGLHVLLVESRNEYCDDTWVAQEGLPSPKALLRQRTRWAQGGMQCSRYLGQVLRSRTLATPAALEIAYFLLIPWTQIVGTIAYGTAGATMAYYAITTPGGMTEWFLAGGWGLIPLVVVFGIVPIAVWGPVYRSRCEPGISRRRALLISAAYWLYSYAMVLAVWGAFIRLLRRRRSWVRSPRVSATPPTPHSPKHAAPVRGAASARS